MGDRELSLEDWMALVQHAAADCSGAALGIWSMMRARGPFAGTTPLAGETVGQRTPTPGAAGS